ASMRNTSWMSAALTSRSIAAPRGLWSSLHRSRSASADPASMATTSSARPIGVLYRAAVNLPVKPPIEPMLSKAASALPDGDGWIFEPKWDGFRALVFKDGDELYIQSRDLNPLGRYFPELEASLRANLPARCVLDGEIVIAIADKLEFEALLLRIH